MLSLVSKKKSELLAKTDRLEEQKEALVLQIDRHGGAGDDGSGVSDEEWREKYEAIKAQLPVYKAMKKELGELEGEVRGQEG
jgi:intraflagellar transport protein 81